MSRSRPSKRGNGSRASLGWWNAAGTAAVITAVATIVVALIANHGGQPSTPPPPGTTATPPSSQVPSADAAATLRIGPADRKPGIGRLVAVFGQVSKKPSNQTLWLVSTIPDNTPQLYYARSRVEPSPDGSFSVRGMEFGPAEKPSYTWNLFVVSATPEARRHFQEDLSHPPGKEWDGNRLRLPPGATIVSDVVQVKRDR